MINVQDGRLYFDGCDTVQLAKEFGTPVFVYSKQGIIDKLTELKECFVLTYPKNRIAYAAKAFFPLAMGQLLQQQGVCVDVVSGGELYTAIKAGVTPENIEFNGNNKSKNELEMAIDYGIGRIIVDGLQELSLIEEICEKKQKKASILFRITPGVKVDSHDYIVTGKKDSKFGIPLEDAILLPQVEAAIRSPYIEFLGLHFHVGSQLLENSSHLQAVEKLLELVGKIKQTFGYDLQELNIGGGFGVRYTEETPPPFAYFITPIMEKIVEYYEERGLPLPAVVTEPGRSIVAENAICLYTVGSIKEIPGVRKYISVDGGMGDNIRPSLYDAKYTAVLANKADAAAEEVVTISGKYCESGDILIKDIELPKAEAGDVLAVFSVGAYGISMASNYNKNPLPGVIWINEGKAEWIVQPQSYEDMLKNEVLPG